MLKHLAALVGFVVTVPILFIVSLHTYLSLSILFLDLTHGDHSGLLMLGPLSILGALLSGPILGAGVALLVLWFLNKKRTNHNKWSLALILLFICVAISSYFLYQLYMQATTTQRAVSSNNPSECHQLPTEDIYSCELAVYQKLFQAGRTNTLDCYQFQSQTLVHQCKQSWID